MIRNEHAQRRGEHNYYNIINIYTIGLIDCIIVHNIILSYILNGIIYVGSS